DITRIGHSQSRSWAAPERGAKLVNAASAAHGSDPPGRGSSARPAGARCARRHPGRIRRWRIHVRPRAGAAGTREDHAGGRPDADAAAGAPRLPGDHRGPACASLVRAALSRRAAAARRRYRVAFALPGVVAPELRLDPDRRAAEREWRADESSWPPG